MTDPKHCVVAFDFDHTVLDDNSDVVVQELGEIPKELRTGSPLIGWTAFMDSVFVHLKEKHGVTPEQLLDRVRAVPLSPGIGELFDFLSGPPFQVIIVSDANSEFVRVVLEKHNLTALIPEKNIFTNPAFVDTNGTLRVNPFSPKNLDGSKTHDCPLCPPNMCKGSILEKYKKTRTDAGLKTERIFYAGDGRNDFCPSLRLSEDDIVFCRVGFRLEKLLKEELGKDGAERQLKAKVVFYSDAKDVLNEIKTCVKL